MARHVHPALAVIRRQVDTGAATEQVVGDLPTAVRDALASPDLLQSVLQIAIILAVAFAAYRGARVLIGRLDREVDDPDPIMKRVREQRSRTLASILRSALMVVLGIVAVLTILATLDISIGPFLATLGILSLAVSFGAQSLVKDVINGTFLLIEGQYGIGDVIRVGETGGMVERITLRTTTLRDAHGVVHVIPNGEISTVSNMTKGWSRAVLEIRVAYRADVDHVMAILLDVAREMHADPDWHTVFLEPPEVPGVEDLGESSVRIRLLAKTLPLKQWDVARELRRRIKNRFDEERIEIPSTHVTFYWSDGQNLLRDEGSAPLPARTRRSSPPARHADSRP